MFKDDVLEFTATRREFEEFKSYTKAIPGTRSYKLFWDEQIRRSIEGYHTGRDYIPGYFYFYLNFCPIEMAVASGSISNEIGKNTKGNLVKGFPLFYDGDYEYFHYLDEAEKAGEHAVVVKSRRTGYSWKGASMLNRNYFLIPGSKNYVFAESIEYLTKNGILNKAWDIMGSIDTNTAWSKRRQYKDTDMHKRASYQIMDNGKRIEAGYKSEIMGLVLDDPNKSRGKVGKLILWEEAGNMKHLEKGWQISRHSMEQGKVTFGLSLAFGTGGSDMEEAEGLENLFFNPEGYKIHSVYNTWEEGMHENKCGFFVPAYKNMLGCMDEYGNSDIEKAKSEILSTRDTIKRSANSQKALAQEIAEKPFTPSEAFLRTNINIFPTAELSSWEKTLTHSNVKGFELVGNLEYDESGKVKFVHNPDLSPIEDFPIRKDSDKTGAIVIYSTPYKDSHNQIPSNLYYICHDPYGQDGEGQSLGAAYVILRMNDKRQPDDCIVASYVARPHSMDEYNKNLFLLAEYYNAKIGFENDRGDVISYAKRFRKLQWLQEEFKLPDNKELQSNRNRSYGMHMTEQRKRVGELYLRDWLLEERSIDENGNKLLNLHLIYDVGLIRELIRYNSKGNFDRVSALIIGMFFNRELTHKKIVQAQVEKDPNSFFERNYIR